MSACSRVESSGVKSILISPCLYAVKSFLSDWMQSLHAVKSFFIAPCLHAVEWSRVLSHIAMCAYSQVLFEWLNAVTRCCQVAVCCSVLQCVVVLQHTATNCVVATYIISNLHPKYWLNAVTRCNHCMQSQVIFHIFCLHAVKSFFTSLQPSLFWHIYNRVTSDRFGVIGFRYRVAKTNRTHSLYRSFSAKEPYNQWLVCGKRPAT